MHRAQPIASADPEEHTQSGHGPEASSVKQIETRTDKPSSGRSELIGSEVPVRYILWPSADGSHSEGSKALADAVSHLGEVTIVAPIQEASAIGHALTLRRPLRVDTIAPRTYAVDGTPTDCVNVAITHVL